MSRLYIIIACVALAGCKDVFQYHPYDVRFDGDCDINERNIAVIEEACRDRDTLTVAFISDTHGWYSDMEDMITSVNAHPEVDFVIHGGDLTDCGTTREFEWQRDIMAKLNAPYVALIGNHDFLGTGDEVYKAMYGELNFSFIAARIKFVCLNTNAMEYDYLAAVPDLDFMEEQCTADSALFDRTVICMHARPYCSQFNNNVAKAFEHYVNLFPGVLFCLYGHDHSFNVEDIYGDGVIYYGVTSAEHRSYYIFTITPDDYTYEVVSF